tara:strand:+ start:259 stop:429 length:171 start_codon:yes stop_codon:yes gene_type:complete
MDKNEVSDKIQLKRHAISLEDDPNRIAKLQNDLKILELRMQIEVFRDRIDALQNKH